MATYDNENYDENYGFKSTYRNLLAAVKAWEAQYTANSGANHLELSEIDLELIESSKSWNDYLTSGIDPNGIPLQVTMLATAVVSWAHLRSRYTRYSKKLVQLANQNLYTAARLHKYTDVYFLLDATTANWVPEAHVDPDRDKFLEDND